MNKQNMTRIIIILVIVAMVVGIWFYKQSERKAAAVAVEVLHPDFEFYDNSFDRELMLEHKLPIIVAFGAETCSACRAYKPELARLNAELQGKAIVKFIDIGENRAAARNYPIQVIPTTFFFNADGTPFVAKEGFAISFERHGTQLTGYKGRLSFKQLQTIAKQMGVE